MDGALLNTGNYGSNVDKQWRSQNKAPTFGNRVLSALAQVRKPIKQRSLLQGKEQMRGTQWSSLLSKYANVIK